MKRHLFLTVFIALMAVMAAEWTLPDFVESREKKIYMIRVSGGVGPGLAHFIQKGLESAAGDNAACVIIELDTPGGLGESMRRIIMDILASPVPVVVYVSPSGARAASAGALITMAADIAAMAPGANIGAAGPVGMGGKEIAETMAKKVINDMVANARSVAEKRGRNADWVEKAIRESVSITETQALENNVIDLIAKDMGDLISRLDGFKTRDKGVLELDGAVKIVFEETLRTRILKIISDPNIAYILMMIGLAGLYLEFSHPGVLFPGVAGAIAIVLALFAFQTLPVNYAGVLLILLAVVFFILEMKIASYGLLSLAGTLCLFLGSIMLFNGDGSAGVRISWQVLGTTLTAVSGFFIVVAWLVFRSQSRKPLTGGTGLVGETGVAAEPITPEGRVMVHGEIWKARSPVEIEKGASARVVSVKGLALEVEPADPETDGA
ncbi:Serine protease [Candidatus Desulfarcum epimagneticum]|uniref:Serine protease n=1 Tax=uncultured Desulfobacteraceae bacterium TaxID=218296 RepID=A0A484HM61_9BACT|nr:Serine protease [uncultured Desulfobacteraceae bacterium]